MGGTGNNGLARALGGQWYLRHPLAKVTDRMCDLPAPARGPAVPVGAR